MQGGLLELDADAALVAAVRDGDDGAFGELVARHRDWLTARCRRHLGGDSHAAEDVAQECFVALQRTLVVKDDPMRVRAWLSVVARNRCIDETRKLRAVPMPAIPETAVFDREVGTEDEYLARAWNALTTRHRAVLELRELGGLSYDEIAASLAVTSGAVEALLFRARSALRREYARAGGKVASMVPMQEAVARATGHKGVVTGLAEQGHGFVPGLPSVADGASSVPAPASGPGGLVHELQARLLTASGVDSLFASPAAGGGRLRAVLAAAGLLLGGAATVAGTVASGPAELPVAPAPAVVTVPDAPSVTAPAPTAPAPPAEAPTATTPPPPAAEAPTPTPTPTPPPGPASSPVTVAGVDVPAAVDDTLDTTVDVADGTVGGVAGLLSGLLTRPR